MKSNVLVVALVAIILGAAAGYYFGFDVGFKRATDGLNGGTEEKDDSQVLIRIDVPEDGDVITSPFTVSGEARGQWYFEADFPLILVDWDGRIIAQSFATAQGEWMTTEFVPFTGTIEFEKPYDEEDNVPDFMKRGALIFKKDNPSGLPEHDDAVEIPIRFE